MNEESLSLKKSSFISILPLCIPPSPTLDYTNLLLYCVLKTIQEKGDMLSMIEYVDTALESIKSPVDIHSILLSCCFFLEESLTSIQTIACSTLLSHLVEKWLSQKQTLSQEVYALLLLFIAIGHNEDLLQKIMQLLLTSSSSTSISLQDCYCQEEKILLSYCYSHSIATTFSSSSFLHLLFLFSSSKQDIEYFFTLQSSQQDTYSIQFTIFLYSSFISSQ